MSRINQSNSMLFLRTAMACATTIAATALTAQAHFVFVVPDASGQSAKVFLSETLAPAGEVDVAIVSGTTLSLRDAGGNETPLTLTREGKAFTVPLSGSGTRLIHGTTDLGWMERGQDKYVLIYYPKTIVGDAFTTKRTGGKAAPVEIVPVGKPGEFSLLLLVHGQPQAASEMTVISPDGKQEKVQTDGSGQTHTFHQNGRYGAWARYWEAAGGERDGKHYDQTRHYATLVFDSGTASDPQQSAAAVTARTATNFATLPEPTASFGAVVSGDWLYVYGGHVARTHSYSVDAVSGKFNRLNLATKVWESLPSGPAMQGMNLAEHDGLIYRVGGMQPRNKAGEKQAIFSLAECARFDPATQTWSALPPLPEPRSSHDVVVIGNMLIVVGGWTLKGSLSQTEWRDTLLTLDLASSNPEWKTVPQPFRRRALIAAAFGGKMYVMGGFDDKSKISRDVDIYDPQSGVWTKGPNLPAGENSGFAPAACTYANNLYLDNADGGLYRLDQMGKMWTRIGRGAPRLANRIAPYNNEILVIGGAANENDSDLIEAIAIGSAPPSVPQTN